MRPDPRQVHWELRPSPAGLAKSPRPKLGPFPIKLLMGASLSWVRRQTPRLLLIAAVARSISPFRLYAVEAETKLRQNVWAVGLESRPLYFGGNEQQKLTMTASTIDISRIWLKKSWWASVDASLIIGPWSQRRGPISPPLDFNGTAFSARLAMPLFAEDMRQASGDFGLTLGIEIVDLVGRSYRVQNIDAVTSTDAWAIQARWTAITPGIFLSSLKAGRPKGNRPEWLVTRIEGYTLVLAAALPVQSQIKQKYNINSVSLLTKDKLQGYALQIALSTWLGI